MRSAQVVAVVVAFEPDAAALTAMLTCLRPQVEGLLLVDNSDSAAGKACVLQLASAHAAELLPQQGNQGIAAALNRGVAHAVHQGADYVLLMDQDSLPADDMVLRLLQAMLQGQAAYSGGRVAAVGPRFVDARGGVQVPFARVGFPSAQAVTGASRWATDCVEPDWLITSGCLLNPAAVATLGGMREGLFIDNVDLEWSFRVRAAGWLLLGVPAAQLGHRLGDRRLLLRLPGTGWSRPLVVHSPRRLYYIMRNRLALYRMTHVPWRWKCADALRVPVKFFLFSCAVSPRAANVRMMLRGLWDGLRGTSGPLQT